MSLVEEALRKQEQETGKSFIPAAPAVVPPPAAPAETTAQPPGPPAGSPAIVARPGIPRDVGRQRTLARLLLAGAGWLVLLLAAGVVILMAGNISKRAAARAAPLTVQPAVPPLPAAEMPPPSVVIAVTAAPAAASPASMPYPAIDTVQVASAVSAPMAGIAPSVSTAAVAAVTSTGSEPAGKAAPVLPPPLPVAVWPEIAIKGIFSAAGKTFVPLADGLTLETGVIAPNGIQLLEATPALIRVSFKGQSRTYRRSGGSFIACTNETGAYPSGR